MEENANAEMVVVAVDGGRRWLTVVVYAATNIYLSTQRGSHYHPVPSLRRKRHAYPSERLMAGLERQRQPEKERRETGRREGSQTNHKRAD